MRFLFHWVSSSKEKILFTPLSYAQGFMFLYRGRAGMLTMISVLSFGNTQWDAPMFQILVPVSDSRPCCSFALMLLAV